MNLGRELVPGSKPVIYAYEDKPSGQEKAWLHDGEQRVLLVTAHKSTSMHPTANAEWLSLHRPRRSSQQGAPMHTIGGLLSGNQQYFANVLTVLNVVVRLGGFVKAKSCIHDGLNDTLLVQIKQCLQPISHALDFIPEMS